MFRANLGVGGVTTGTRYPPVSRPEPAGRECNGVEHRNERSECGAEKFLILLTILGLGEVFNNSFVSLGWSSVFRI